MLHEARNPIHRFFKRIWPPAFGGGSYIFSRMAVSNQDF